MSEYKEIIRNNLRKYRKLSGLSQRDLAAQIGVTSAAISNWEKGLNFIDIDTLFKVCEVLRVSISDMGEIEETGERFETTHREEELVKAFRRCTPERQNIVLELVGLKGDILTSQGLNSEGVS